MIGRTRLLIIQSSAFLLSQYTALGMDAPQPPRAWPDLHQAAYAGDLVAVAKLIEQKADVHERTDNGQTALDLAQFGETTAHIAIIGMLKALSSDHIYKKLTRRKRSNSSAASKMTSPRKTPSNQTNSEPVSPESGKQRKKQWGSWKTPKDDSSDPLPQPKSEPVSPEKIKRSVSPESNKQKKSNGVA